MVIDEAQRMKEPTAQCTRHGFDIAAQVPNRYLLTGTPVLNRETELHTLLRLSGHPIGQLPLKEFCDRFAGNPEFRQSLRAELVTGCCAGARMCCPASRESSGSY